VYTLWLAIRPSTQLAANYLQRPRLESITAAHNAAFTWDFRYKNPLIFVVVSRICIEMAVLLELHNIGDPGADAEVRALVEHALSDRTGDWRVAIVGSVSV
jgi:hypothetical protein